MTKEQKKQLIKSEFSIDDTHKSKRNLDFFLQALEHSQRSQEAKYWSKNLTFGWPPLRSEN